MDLTSLARGVVLDTSVKWVQSPDSQCQFAQDGALVNDGCLAAGADHTRRWSTPTASGSSLALAWCLLDVASESEFVASMRALGLPDDSPTMREVLEIWRQSRS